MRAAIGAIIFIWAGVLLGVSFIATPAKFLAPSLPLAQALDVGRWTFHVLALIEWPIAIALLAALFMCRPRPLVAIACLAAIVVILATQTLYLRPLLDGRVLAIIAGQNVPPSQWHEVFIGLELLKLLLIVAAGITLSRRASEATTP